MLSTIILIVIAIIVVGGLGLWLFGERWQSLRRSTWLFLRQAGLQGILNGCALHAWGYGRWIKEYINLLLYHVFPRLGPQGKKWLSDHYHSKVL